MPMKVGVARETAAGERRVALVPEALGKLTAAGLEILVEAGAGAGCRHPRPGVHRRRRDGRLHRRAVRHVATSSSGSRSRAGRGRRGLRSGQALVGLLQPLLDPALAQALADAGVTAISLDAIPRTLSRAQTMDALSSQANVGGYKAVLIAANAYPPLLPAADDRGRHGQARERPDPRDRRRRAPGDRHGEAPRRGRPRVRRPARDARAGREPGREVRQAQDARSTRPAPAATPAS